MDQATSKPRTGKKIKKSGAQQTKQQVSQPKNPKKGSVSKKDLVSPGVETIKKLAKAKTFKNGIPKNKYCKLPYKDLCNFFYFVKDEIAEQIFSLKSLTDDLKNTDDGSNGLDDFLGGKISTNEKINTDLITHHQSKLDGLKLVERRIMNGEFSNICKCGEKISLERLQVFPETRQCAACARKFG